VFIVDGLLGKVQPQTISLNTWGVKLWTLHQNKWLQQSYSHDKKYSVHCVN